MAQTLHLSTRSSPRIIAFPERFKRAASFVDSLDVWMVAARRLHPAAVPPSVACNSSTAFAQSGVLSLSATHAAAWEEVLSTNDSLTIFEDDIDAAAPAVARSRLRALATSRRRPHECDLVLLGHCGRSERRCTHAYVVTPRAAHWMLSYYHAHAGCVQPDDPQEVFCQQPGVCCHSAQGKPGPGLFGGGIFGQNRSMAHYLHGRPCIQIPRAQWARASCKSARDFETLGDGTKLTPTPSGHASANSWHGQVPVQQPVADEWPTAWRMAEPTRYRPPPSPPSAEHEMQGRLESAAWRAMPTVFIVPLPSDLNIDLLDCSMSRCPKPFLEDDSVRAFVRVGVRITFKPSVLCACQSAVRSHMMIPLVLARLPGRDPCIIYAWRVLIARIRSTSFAAGAVLRQPEQGAGQAVQMMTLRLPTHSARALHVAKSGITAPTFAI